MFQKVTNNSQYNIKQKAGKSKICSKIYIPPVTNIPGASGSQARVLTLAETGKMYLVMTRIVLMSTSHSAPP